MLAFAAEHPFVLAAQIARLLDMAEPAAATRLRALRRRGYLAKGWGPHGEPLHHRVTTPGLRVIGSDLPAPREEVNLATYRHEAGVAWLALGAQRGIFGPASDVVSDRRMRSQDGRASAGEERFGVRLGAAGPGGHDRLHYPDLLLVTDTGHRVAFELELTLKGRRRREGILNAYSLDRRIDAVVYLMDNPARRRAMRESVRRLGIGDRVRVEGVTLGHRPRGSGPSRTAGRSAARRVQQSTTSAGAGEANR
jgi:hypothetical protein